MYKKTCCHVAYFRIFKIVVKIRLRAQFGAEKEKIDGSGFVEWYTRRYWNFCTEKDRNYWTFSKGNPVGTYANGGQHVGDIRCTGKLKVRSAARASSFERIQVRGYRFHV